jgi:hypothetical protein
MFVKILLAISALLLAHITLASAENVTITGEGATVVYNGETISKGEVFSFTFNCSPIFMDGTEKQIVGHVIVGGVTYPVFKKDNFLKHVQEGDYHPALDSNSYYFADYHGKSYVIYEVLTADSKEITQATNLTMVEG